MEEVVHDPAVQAISNTSIAVIASAITAVGMAALGLIAYALNIWFKWRKGTVEVTGLQTEADLTKQKRTTQLRIEAMDDQIARWKALAEKAWDQVGEAKAKADKAVDEANARTLAERKICDDKLEVAAKKSKEEMLEIVNRYRAREDLATKQHQEREEMFNEIVTKIREENDERMQSFNTRHQACLEESAELRGEIKEIKEGRERDRTELEEVKARLGRLDMREVSGRKPRSKPEIDLNKE